MTYRQQLNDLLGCTDKESARVWLMQEIRRYEMDYHKATVTARRQIIQNLLNTALSQGTRTWERVVLLLEP
jgi:hypothetical protein